MKLKLKWKDIKVDNKKKDKMKRWLNNLTIIFIKTTKYT